MKSCRLHGNSRQDCDRCKYCDLKWLLWMNIHPQIGPVCFQQLHCRCILSERAVVIEIIHAVCTCFLPAHAHVEAGVLAVEVPAWETRRDGWLHRAAVSVSAETVAVPRHLGCPAMCFRISLDLPSTGVMKNGWFSEFWIRDRDLCY